MRCVRRLAGAVLLSALAGAGALQAEATTGVAGRWDGDGWLQRQMAAMGLAGNHENPDRLTIVQTGRTISVTRDDDRLGPKQEIYNLDGSPSRYFHGSDEMTSIAKWVRGSLVINTTSPQGPRVTVYTVKGSRMQVDIVTDRGQMTRFYKRAI